MCSPRSSATKGHFHISTQELCDAVIEAKKETKKQKQKKSKKKRKAIMYETKSNRDYKEKVEDQIETDTEDCIIVDVE